MIYGNIDMNDVYIYSFTGASLCYYGSVCSMSIRLGDL